MARAVAAAIRPSMSGSAATPVAPTVDGDAVQPGTALLITNGSAAAITVTVPTPGTVGQSGLAIADHTVTVAAGATVLVGPFTEQVFRQTTGATAGLVHVDYSAVASVTRTPIALGY